VSSWVGKTLGKVRIDSLLARGGVAEVYIGTHTNLQRTVAVKILQNQNAEDADSLERFQREARVVAKLRHPNIVQVFDFDTIGNDPYLVMEHVQGPSLSRYLHALHQKKTRLDVPHALKLIDAIAGALQYAHEIGVIHRDIKPGNILLTSRSVEIKPGEPLPDDFEPILTDFGLVRFLDSSRKTATGQIAGTPAYMSPEQARGETTDGRTDIYSLGVVLYEILAGHLPFDGETTMSIMLKHVNEPPPPIPGLSPSVQNVLDRALAKNLNDRFQTPAEFALAFRKAVEMGNVHSTLALDTPAPTPSQLRSRTRPKRRWILGALAGILLIGISAFLLINGIPAFNPGITPTTIPPSVEPISSSTAIPVGIPLGPTGILRFQNGAKIADRASLIAQAMPAPPADSQYEVWLIGREERISLGILSLDKNGKGELVFTNDQGVDLVAVYEKVEVTIEPKPDPDPESSGMVAYSFTLPSEGLVHVRYLLSSYPNTPREKGLIQGLYTAIKKADEIASEMQKAAEIGDEASARLGAEAIMNLILGNQSTEYKDWTGDGQITDFSDGYGLFLNGSNFGYLQAVFTEADYAANTPGASQQMITHGEHVKISVQNLALWTPQLQELVLAILKSPGGSDIKQLVLDTSTLAAQMLNGVDTNEDGEIEPVPGEGGAQTAYEHAYFMADMPLLPTGLFSISNGTPGTGTPSIIGPLSTAAPTKSGGSANTPALNPTEKPKNTPPGQVKTERPPPPGQTDKPPKNNEPPPKNK
jgi:serine/threonine protein kinase